MSYDCSVYSNHNLIPLFSSYKHRLIWSDTSFSFLKPRAANSYSVKVYGRFKAYAPVSQSYDRLINLGPGLSYLTL